MPVVNNVEDARVEISALRKERSLLLRLATLIRDEVVRLQNDVRTQPAGMPLRKITNT